MTGPPAPTRPSPLPKHSTGRRVLLRIVGVVEPFPIFVGSSMGGGSFLAAPELDAQIVSYHEERLTDLVQRVRRSGRDVAGVASAVVRPRCL